MVFYKEYGRNRGITAVLKKDGSKDINFTSENVVFFHWVFRYEGIRGVVSTSLTDKRLWKIERIRSKLSSSKSISVPPLSACFFYCPDRYFAMSHGNLYFLP